MDRRALAELLDERIPKGSLDYEQLDALTTAVLDLERNDPSLGRDQRELTYWQTRTSFAEARLEDVDRICRAREDYIAHYPPPVGRDPEDVLDLIPSSEIRAALRDFVPKGLR